MNLSLVFTTSGQVEIHLNAETAADRAILAQVAEHDGASVEASGDVREQWHGFDLVDVGSVGHCTLKLQGKRRTTAQALREAMDRGEAA